MAETGAFWRLYEELKAGRLSRREFMRRATALGVTLPVVLFVLQARKLGGSGALAQDAASGRPTIGTENQQRGEGGELKMLQWQAATHASLHTSTGFKDTLAASLSTEPLMSFAADGTLLPTLVKEVPSLENGLLSEDLKTVTYNLLDGVLWSDGEPFTANDVVFTWQWVMHPDNAATSVTSYQVLENVEAIDDLTVKLTFKEPTLGWYLPFTSTLGAGGVYPAHYWDNDPTKQGPIDTFRQAPVGTGPYVMESFSENDQAIYVINEHYREPNKPFFSKVNLKGGGDATSTARAVLETGDWHVAWNLQVEPQILEDLEEGGKGKVVVILGTRVERIEFNFSDPNTEKDGQRSHKDVPHPIFTDPKVRQAFALGCDRETVANEFYSEGEDTGLNILTGVPAFESPNTSWEFNVEAGKQLLEEAGWVLDGDVRTKDGKELSVTYTTSINPVRQKTQAVIKQSWEEMGIKAQLKQVDAGIFFDSAPGNEQSYTHFYNDLEMFTNGAADTYPLSYMALWWAGPEGVNIAQKENDWSGTNEQRYNNPEYDALYDELVATTDAERAAELFIKLNDILINEFVLVPIVHRASEVYGISNELRNENVALGAFEVLYWNIANWNLAG